MIRRTPARAGATKTRQATKRAPPKIFERSRITLSGIHRRRAV